MIKRRFYKLEHGDRDAPSESSSSSESEFEAVASDSSDEEEEDVFGSVQVREKDEPDLSSTGYESEDSSAHEINLDSTGLPTSDEESGPQRNGSHPSGLASTKSFIKPKVVTEQDDEDLRDLPDCVVKHKSVFKCRLCPKIVCLSKETLIAHIKSKRHARSEKLLKEGRLKNMLDPNGRIEESKSDEEDQGISPTEAFAQDSGKPREKKRGSRGQKTRSNKKPERSNSKSGRPMKSLGRKKRRQEDSD
ncbi:hypothetical protein Leryth_010417 [Lithospermum erythrorhizon]|nr:hypothetical protein Leryth_010417 [Lithospermum erythrorhizon]